MNNDVYVDISGVRRVAEDVIAMDRMKAYQIVLSILAMLATTDAQVEEDDDLLPPMP